MRRHEALEAACEECRKAGRNFKYEKMKAHTHIKLFIEGVKRVLIISDTRAINNVRSDVRKAIRGI